MYNISRCGTFIIQKSWFYVFLFFVFLYVEVLQGLEVQPALWMRYPAISPNGKYIVFSCQGNLYMTSSNGGRAFPLTMHPAHDFQPVWSNDSQRTTELDSNHFPIHLYLTRYFSEKNDLRFLS